MLGKDSRFLFLADKYKSRRRSANAWQRQRDELVGRKRIDFGCLGLLTFRIVHHNLNHMNYRDYITIDPNKRGGKPCVRGLRITVYEVLEYLASNMTEAQILEDFPDLTREDLKACIAFAADRERRLTTVPAA